MSYWKANQWKFPNMNNTGFEAHYHLFKEIETLTGEVPLVINSEELAKQPKKYLKFICAKFEVNFSEKMLTWDSNPKETNLRWTEKTSCSNFYSEVLNSKEFLFLESEEIELPKDLIPLYEKALFFYEKMLKYCTLI